MITQEERERALEMVIEYVDCQGTPAEPKEEAAILRTCVPVEREYLERLERAVWVAIMPYINDPEEMLAPVFALATTMGFVEDNDDDVTVLTPAAHEFAARMKERDET